MIPQMPGIIVEQIEFVRQPSLTYKDQTTAIIGHVDGIEALIQSYIHRMRIERYAYPIYGDNYGIELQQYIGNTFEFLEATIEKTVYDCLIQDDRTISVTLISVTKLEIDAALVNFNVATIWGVIEMEKIVNV